MRAPTGEEEGSVSIAGIELCWLDLTLERPVSTARGAHAARPVIVVRVLTSAGEGFGECAALAEPTYGYEHAEGAWQVMESHLVPRLLAEPPGSPAGLMSALAGLRGHRMA
ncbi:MAG: o-succinylbenzoate synthase, partial [Acidimicrobiales bacterium]